MKRNLRAIIAAMLAAVMAFSGLTAFAAVDTSAKLEWDFYDEIYYYDFAGELTEGENKIDNSISDYVYYTFDVQTSGYYILYYNFENLNAWIGVPEKYENGKAYDEAGRIYYSPENCDGFICYFEKGEQILALDLYYTDENSVLNIEFFGEDVAEIKVDYDLIYNYDIYTYEWEGDICFDINCESVITFTSGKSITYYISGICDSEIVKGENTLAAELCGKEYDFDVNVYYITDIVESVELSNVEDYLEVTEYYNGTETPSPFGETLTVTFKDGTTDTVILDADDHLTLPNGRNVWCYTDYEYTDDGMGFKIYVAGTEVDSFECKVVPASIKENIDAMNSSNSDHLSISSYYLRRAFSCLMEGDIDSAIMRIQWAIESFMYIFSEAASLISYLLA